MGRRVADGGSSNVIQWRSVAIIVLDFYASLSVRQVRSLRCALQVDTADVRVQAWEGGGDSSGVGLPCEGECM